MARKEFNVNLFDGGSVQLLYDYLESYADNLIKNVYKFIEKLRNDGADILKTNVQSIKSSGDIGDDLTITVEPLSIKNGIYSCSLVLSGSEVAFIEFGAGITYNAPAGQSTHPKGRELGYTIGSYNPNSNNATNPKGWWYTDKQGNTSQHTYGTPAYMPLYDTYLQIQARVYEIAREVFGV